MKELIDQLYERHCQGDDLCGKAQKALEQMQAERNEKRKREDLSELTPGWQDYVNRLNERIEELEAELNTLWKGEGLAKLKADNERLRDKAKKAYEKGVKDALAAVQEKTSSEPVPRPHEFDPTRANG